MAGPQQCGGPGTSAQSAKAQGWLRVSGFHVVLAGFRAYSGFGVWGGRDWVLGHRATGHAAGVPERLCVLTAQFVCLVWLLG